MIRFVPLDRTLMAWAAHLAGERLAHELTQARPEMLDHMAASSGGEVMLDGGELIGAGGVMLHWAGRAEAWLMLRPDATPRQRIAALRRCQKRLAALQRAREYRRIEMYVPLDVPWRRRFAEVLGMELEAVCRKWCPRGHDFCLYSRIVDPQ